MLKINIQKSMIYTKNFFTILIFFSLVACKTQQNNTGSDTKTQNTVVTTGVENAPVSDAAETAPDKQTQAQSLKDMKYRFIVSFISIGEGTDRNAKAVFETVLQKWQDKGQKIDYISAPWGREGEVDFCFPLAELSESEKGLFISEMRERLKSSSLVQFFENETCRHIR